MRQVTVNENDGGQRIDKFITKLMPKLPGSMLYKGLRKKCVRLNGRHVKEGSVRVESGDVLQLYFNDEFFEQEPDFVYVKPELDIVYEDENILVINKAVGVLVHPDAGKKSKTLVDMVQSYLYAKGEYDPVRENTFRPSLCNRLDRNTGGLVIAAKNASALREVNESIRNRSIKKYYMAVAEGYTEDSGRLDGYVTRSGLVTSVADRNSSGAKKVSLSYRAVARKNGYTLLEIELHTGRTHQIRSQLSFAGFPLAGDTKYGGHGGRFRQALWSVRLVLSFDAASPLAYLNGKEINVKAPFETEFFRED